MSSRRASPTPRPSWHAPRSYCCKLEELIAVGKATLHAANQMPLPQMSRPEPNGVTVVPELAKNRK